MEKHEHEKGHWVLMIAIGCSLVGIAFGFLIGFSVGTIL